MIANKAYPYLNTDMFLIRKPALQIRMALDITNTL